MDVVYRLAGRGRPFLELTETPIQWVADLVISRVYSGRSVMLTTHLHVVPGLGMSRAVPSRLLFNGYRVSFQGVKRPGRNFDNSPLSSVEVKE
jgi:hypothetical protein